MSSVLSIELPEAVSDLVSESAFSQYTVGGPSSEFENRLERLTVSDLFPGGIADQNMASCCVSGILLLHNLLDASHEISQSIPTREGSFWHGIMHRMEGDFWNSKYWYRKVGDHPAFQEISLNWDPYEFVDQCEAAQSKGGSALDEARHLAVAEWKALFEFCFRAASDN